jgi:hypothetical protein
MNPRKVEGLQWMALTMVGLIAGLGLALPLGIPIFAVLGAMVGTPLVLGIIGLTLGTAQWPILRRYFSPAWLWIVASALGMAVGLTAGVVFVEQIGRAIVGGPLNFRMLGAGARALSFGVIGVSGGASLGLAQWIVLRRHAPGTSSWIRINAGSLGAGLAGGSLLADTLMLRSGSLAGTAVMLLIGSGVAGAFTSRALNRIFAEGPLRTSA